MAEYDGLEDEDSGSESGSGINGFSDSERTDDSASKKSETSYDDSGHEIVYIASDAEHELDADLDGGSESAARRQTGGRLRGLHRV
ncbi:hypothetical protein LTR87_017087 [Friedmanniomyces endolithicus]|nr:hypothetical protein LTR87_017087 [Friedmanniomyces endolithicus]